MLSISKAEAQSGVAYPLTLPGGRLIIIAVPAGVRNGQSIRQEGMGKPAYAGGPPRALIITIAVKPGPDSIHEITNHLQNLSQQMRTLSQDVANLHTQVSKNINQQQSFPNDITMQLPHRGIEQIVPQKLQHTKSAPLPSPIHNQGTATQPEEPPQINQPQSIQSAPRNKPPIIENQQILPTNAQNIRSKLTSKPPSRRAIIALSILVTLIIASSGIFYVYQNQNTNTNTNSNQYPSYLPGHGTLALFDSLDGANNQYNWNTTNGCNFSNKAYYVTNSNSSTIQNCVAASINFTNFAFEVTMTINHGDCGGVAFRASSSTTNYYSLELCTNGIYNLAINTDNTTVNAQYLLHGNIGNNNQSSNLIDVLANGSQIAIYINQQLSNSVTDTTLSQGQIGLLAANTFSAPTTDVSYTNAKVWTL